MTADTHQLSAQATTVRPKGEESTEKNEPTSGRLVEETVNKEVLVAQPLIASPLTSKFVRVDDYMTWVRIAGNPDFEHDLEVETDDFIRADYRVITGIGVRANPGNVTTLRVAYRLLDNETGQLGQVKYMTAGMEPNHELEVWIYPVEEENDDQVILSGFGARAANGANLTTLRVWTRDILTDGTLAQPIEHRYGPAKDSLLEALIMVPNPGIIVGVGMRGSPGNVTHLKAWFGHLKRRS